MKTFKRLRKLQGLAATRLRLGFTQEAFAMELGISQSMLCRVENGTRQLPAAALKKLSALVILLTKSPLANDPIQSGLPDLSNLAGRSKVHPGMSDKEKSCYFKAENYQFKLDKMVSRYQQLVQSLNEVEFLISAEKSDGSQPLFRTGHLELQRNSLLCKLKSCDLAAQAALRQKIRLSYAAAEMHAQDCESNLRNSGQQNHTEPHHQPSPIFVTSSSYAVQITVSLPALRRSANGYSATYRWHQQWRTIPNLTGGYRQRENLYHGQCYSKCTAANPGNYS